jgi:nucleoside-diphosphate-sugar epimerase
MKVLVTGASGFIGHHVVRALLGAKRNVSVLVRSNASLARLRDVLKEITVVKADILNLKSVEKAVKLSSPDIVFNCAAYGVFPNDCDPDVSYRVNVLGALMLLELCAKRKAKRYLQLGSCFEYKSFPRPLTEEDPLEPNSIYGSTKAAASLLVPNWGRAHGIEAIVLRCFSVWGPGEDSHRLVPQLLRSYRTKTTCRLTPGEQIRDYSFVSDMAKWIVRAGMHPNARRYPVINVGTGQGISVRQFATKIAKQLGSADLLKFGSRPYRKEEKPHLIADVHKLVHLIGPLRETPLERALKEMGQHD